MKVCIAYPPLQSRKGTPLLSQNRQFQWSKSRTIVYPVIPASAATILAKHGYEIIWLDGIAENWSYSQWFNRLLAEKPDLIFLESKTPVIKQLWKITKQLKKRLPQMVIVMGGDHVTALPNETLKHAPVNFILQGGNYDEDLFNLAEDIRQKRPVDSIYHGKPFDIHTLPLIDRKLTKWQLYARNNGNFSSVPGAYIMSGRDCWWRQRGGCTFCSWTTLFPQFALRSVDNVLDEIDGLIHMGVKEIFDDTGTFPTGVWLKDFCEGMIKRGYHKKVVFGCNMRFGYLTQTEYSLMAKAGFRLILYGLESANQKTLNRLNKGTSINSVKAELEVIRSVKGNLQPHVTCMIGYPWETKIDATKTVAFCQELFTNGLIHSLQATIVIPYPGTRLFKEAKKKQWLRSLDWNRYDMKQAVLKNPISDRNLMAITRSIYLTAFNPRFIFDTLSSIKSFNDLSLLGRTTYKYIARLIDFTS